LIHVHDRAWTTRNPTGEILLWIRPFHTHTPVNLCHLVAQVDMHRLDVSVVVQSVLSQLTTDCESEVIEIRFAVGAEGEIRRTSALLEATEWHIGV